MQMSRFMLCLALVAIGCSDEDSALKLGERASKAILASEGGTIALKSGATMEIPAGALAEDTTITITEVLGRGSENFRLGGLVMEPDGLVFAQPATVRLPLPAGWDPEQIPVVYYARGSDPTRVLPSGEQARVVEGDGGYYSEHSIHHFSCTAAATNCHAGTLKHIINTIEARGCADAEGAIFAAVKKKYSMELDKSDCASAGPDQIQAVLDIYFEDKGGWDPGMPMPAEKIQQALQATRAGRLVVLAFSDRAWGSRGGKHNFYPGGILYAHTAPLRLENDEVVIRNTIASANYELQTHFGGKVGGEVAISWPLSGLEELRSMQTGVMIETAACGEPDCLAYPDRNKWKMSIFNPVAGADYTADGGSKIKPRSVSWPSVRLYIERAPAGAPNLLVSQCPAGDDGGGEQPVSTTYAVWYTGNVLCWDAPQIHLTDQESFEMPELASSFEGGGTDSTTLVDKKLLQGGFATEDEARAWICPQFTGWRASYWCGRHDLIGEQRYWYAGSLGCDFSALPQVE